MAGRAKFVMENLKNDIYKLTIEVPYEVGEDLTDRKFEDYMLLCGSCNRAKSWSCEHCDNWKTAKKPPVCMQCYWGSPENYNHIAMEQVRRLDLQWDGDEIKYYDALKIIADNNKIKLQNLSSNLLQTGQSKRKTIPKKSIPFIWAIRKR